MTQPAIVQAAQSETLLQAALRYAALGFSIIPLQGKRPAINSWLPYRNRAASPDIIRRWQQGGLLENIGVVCGPVSKNLVVLDLDGEDGYPTFAATFPQLAETYTVATGGGIGRHVYFRPTTLSPSVRAMNTPIGHVELRGDGYQIVLPPSIHPETHQPYRVWLPHDILQPADLQAVVAWVEGFRPKPMPTVWQPPHLPPVAVRPASIRVSSKRWLNIFEPKAMGCMGSGCTARVSTRSAIGMGIKIRASASTP
ncbi:MAG: bifunctional DNA primase/polymerase [Anaerolineae bacterium]|nr:bifunctional DNA primase/polymerase [Anaerolineae bacterium]